MKSLSVKLEVILIGLIIFGYSEAWGSESKRPTLLGLRGVYVLIENLKPNLEKDGLTREQLLTDVELKLRKAGIRVLTEEESYNTPGLPCLYARINAIKGNSTFYCVNIHVSLSQETRLERNPTIKILSFTWDHSSIGGCDESIIKDYVRKGLGDLIDKFINDYLAVNPK